MIACVLIPGFLAMTERHNKAAQHGQPIILYASNGQKRYVYSLCREAVSAGVIPGMPLRQAQTLCPDAQLIPANPPRYREALNALIDTLALFTNRLEAEGLPRFGKHWRRRSGLPMHSAAYHMVAYLDLGKLPSGEALDLGRQIQRAIETYQHMQASVGLASNKFTAYVAARLQKAGSVQLVRPGDEAGFLARRPVTLLPLESEIARRLRLFGIRTIGAYAALPGGALLAQFGKPGRLLHQLARGQDDRLVPLLPERREIKARQAFDDPLDEVTLGGVVTLLTLQMVHQLEKTGYALRSLHMTLLLENGSAQETEIIVRRPSADLRHLQTVSEQLLRRLAVHQGVMAVELLASDLTTVEHRQLELFLDAQSDATASAVLEDLIARFGECTFYQASVANTRALLAERRFELDALGAA